MVAKYRSEIDGLRAIAVFFVVAFHFFPTKVPLGYLGVDLFFVISGYVITAQISRQLNERSFSFFEFYSRRIRRILPVSFFVIFVVILAGSLILMPNDFSSLVESAVASSIFFIKRVFLARWWLLWRQRQTQATATHVVSIGRGTILHLLSATVVAIYIFIKNATMDSNFCSKFDKFRAL